MKEKSIAENPRPVTETEMLARINRTLLKKQIVKSQSPGEKEKFGDFYIRETGDGTRGVIQDHIDPVEYARKAGIMKDGEVIRETKP